MRKLVVMALVGAMLAGAPAALAAPGNDDFAGAEAVAVPFTVTASTAEATTQDGEQLPCGEIGATVWYRLDGDGSSVVLDTRNSSFDTVLAAYTGASLEELALIACNDDTIGLASQVAFTTTAGETYWIQAGGFAGSTGDLTLNGAPAGTVAGAVTAEDTGEPLSGVCVQAYDESYGLVGQAVTTEDGSYALAVPSGAQRILFTPWCGLVGVTPVPEPVEPDEPVAASSTPASHSWPSYQAEWWDDKPDFETADVLTIAAGDAISGIDAALTPAPTPPSPVDAAVTGLSVENVPVRTDYGDVVYTGVMRRVHVDAANLSDTDAGTAVISVRACAETIFVTLSCRLIGEEWLELGAHQSVSRTFRWNGAGMAGDVKVVAHITVCTEEYDYENNTRAVEHYVVAGGVGAGVDATPFWDGFGEPCGPVIEEGATE